MSLKSQVVGELNLNLKNMIGWRTNRKFIVFSIDDYGNVRNNSKQSRDILFKNGLTPKSVFDLYDTLESESDLVALYETLSSVKDIHGNSAVFTAFSTCANIDFEKMIATNFEKFYYEDLDATFGKLPGYENVKKMWNEGIQNKLLIPQFHGREHLNVNVLMQLLKDKNEQVLLNFQNKSYSSIDDVGLNPIPYSAAFDFNKPEELDHLKAILNDGLAVFEKVFGYKATHFNACGSHKYHHSLENTLHENGVKFIDSQRIQHEHHGFQKYSKSFNYSGKKNANNQTYLVRNCVFEPSDSSVDDWVNFTLKQIEAAFRWNKPANISSHRVNFCGHIEESNRANGLAKLNELLKGIIKRWPDVEFISANQLGEEMIKK